MCILHCVPDTPGPPAIAGVDGGRRRAKVKKNHGVDPPSLACAERQTDFPPKLITANCTYHKPPRSTCRLCCVE